jgi:hypothetical protein
MYAVTSAACTGVSVPGAVAGIVVCVFSNRSPTLFPDQFVRKSFPASGGIGPDPSRLSPWQVAHCSLYTASPRFACSTVYTPSLADRTAGTCAPTASFGGSILIASSDSIFESSSVVPAGYCPTFSR